MDNLKKLFGNRLKQLRKARNMTQEQLAEKLDISLPSISYIETGKTYPTVETQEKICQVFGIDYHDLYMFCKTPSNDEMQLEITNAMRVNPEITEKLYKWLPLSNNCVLQDYQF